MICFQEITGCFGAQFILSIAQKLHIGSSLVCEVVFLSLRSFTIWLFCLALLRFLFCVAGVRDGAVCYDVPLW